MYRIRRNAALSPLVTGLHALTVKIWTEDAFSNALYEKLPLTDR